MNWFPWWASWFVATNPYCSSIPPSCESYPFRLKSLFIDNKSSKLILRQCYRTVVLEAILISIQCIVISSMATFIFLSWNYGLFLFLPLLEIHIPVIPTM